MRPGVRLPTIVEQQLVTHPTPRLKSDSKMKPGIEKDSGSHECILQDDCFDVTEENLQFPAKLEELLAHLSTANKKELELKLKHEFYKDPRKIAYNPIAMLKATAYYHLQKEERLTRFHDKLVEDKAFATKLGFEEAPSYSQLWHFMNLRVKPGQLMLLLTKLLQETGKKKGLTVGHARNQDATFLPSKNEQAEYSGYYKGKGYKLEISSDKNLLLPLYGDVYQSTEYEGNYAVPFQEQLKFLDTETSCYDGGYNSLANYGMLCAYYGLQAYFNVDQNTIVVPEVDERKIVEEYAKFWRDADFKVGASFQQMARFLSLKGKSELVGAFYRNARLAEREADGRGFGKKLHQRSLAETVNSVLKEDSSVVKRVRNANVNKARIISLWTLASLQLVGLVKLEQGITSAHSSLKGIIC